MLEELAEWQSRPLDSVYPVVFIDALMVKVRVLSLILWRGGWAQAGRYVIMLRVFCR